MTKANLKRFVFEEELQAYKALRNESKASQLLKAVFKSITTSYSIYVKAGKVDFFEYVLKNTFAEPIICMIDINDSRLRWVLLKISRHNSEKVIISKLDSLFMFLVLLNPNKQKQSKSSFWRLEGLGFTLTLFRHQA